METTNKNSGFTLVEMMIAIAIIALLASVAIPGFIRARKAAQRTSCRNNLQKIEAAKESWAFDFMRVEGDVPSSDDLRPYLKRRVGGFRCPLDHSDADFFGLYEIQPLGSHPTCALAPDDHKL